jgi:hypothetical protein
MTEKQGISLYDLKQLSSVMGDGTDVYVLIDGDRFRAINVDVDGNDIVIEVED